MADMLIASLKTAASGLGAQSMRLRVASENLANAETTSRVPGGDPYWRKTISFRQELDTDSGAALVEPDRIRAERNAFRLEYRPGHPAADARGMVKFPDVSMIIELADIRQASRSYEANLQVIRQARDMISMTIDMMKGT